MNTCTRAWDKQILVKLLHGCRSNTSLKGAGLLCTRGRAATQCLVTLACVHDLFRVCRGKHKSRFQTLPLSRRREMSAPGQSTGAYLRLVAQRGLGTPSRGHVTERSGHTVTGSPGSQVLHSYSSAAPAGTSSTRLVDVQARLQANIQHTKARLQTPQVQQTAATKAAVNSKVSAREQAELQMEKMYQTSDPWVFFFKYVLPHPTDPHDPLTAVCHPKHGLLKLALTTGIGEDLTTMVGASLEQAGVAMFSDWADVDDLNGILALTQSTLHCMAERILEFWTGKGVAYAQLAGKRGKHGPGTEYMVLTQCKAFGLWGLRFNEKNENWRKKYSMLMISSAVEAGLFGRPRGEDSSVDASMRLDLAQSVFCLCFQFLPHHEDRGLEILLNLMSMRDQFLPHKLIHLWRGQDSDFSRESCESEAAGFWVFAGKFTECGAVKPAFDIGREEAAQEEKPSKRAQLYEIVLRVHLSTANNTMQHMKTVMGEAMAQVFTKPLGENESVATGGSPGDTVWPLESADIASHGSGSPIGGKTLNRGQADFLEGKWRINDATQELEVIRVPSWLIFDTSLGDRLSEGQVHMNWTEYPYEMRIEHRPFGNFVLVAYVLGECMRMKNIGRCFCTQAQNAHEGREKAFRLLVDEYEGMSIPERKMTFASECCLDVVVGVMDCVHPCCFPSVSSVP